MSRNSFFVILLSVFWRWKLSKTSAFFFTLKMYIQCICLFLFCFFIYIIFELKMYLVCFLSFLFMTFDIFNIIQYLDVYVSARKYTEKYTFLYLLFHILYLEEKQIFFNVYLIDTCLCLDHQKFFFILFFCITKECNNWKS